MSDNSRDVAVIVGGAVLGGVAAYLFCTNQGRSFRRSLEPALEDFARELNSFRATVEKAAGVASEGWKALNDALGERESSRRFPSAHQTSPF